MSDFRQIWISRQIPINVPNIKFHGSPSSGSHSNICGQTDRQVYRRKDTKNLKRTSLDFAKAPKKNAEEGKQERVNKRNGIHCTYFLSTLLSSCKWRQMSSDNSWDSWIDSYTVRTAIHILQFTSTFKTRFQCQKWHLQLHFLQPKYVINTAIMLKLVT